MTAQIQNAGLSRITAALFGLSWWYGWGIGSGVAASDNDLGAAAPEARASAAVAQGMTIVADDTLILAATITATAPRAITEFGTFDAAAGGNMDLYAETPGIINLNAGDGLTFTLNLRFG
jgi:hypothetical protein